MVILMIILLGKIMNIYLYRQVFAETCSEMRVGSNKLVKVESGLLCLRNGVCNNRYIIISLI